MRSVFNVFCIVALFWLNSCKPGIPSEYIQRGKMEDILYDYHLAQSMLIISSDENTPENQQRYKLSVLKKYGVTEEQFERSMEYYMRHTEYLHTIYEHLSTRFERSALEYGITVSEINQYGAGVAKGDTTDIWGGERAMILTNHMPLHLRSFALKADSTYHAGDRLALNFDTKFIVQEGARDGIAVLSVHFANDSVVSQLQHLSSNSHYTLQVDDRERHGIKSVSGYFLLNEPLSEKSTMLKILSITRIQLVRLHTKEKAMEQKTVGDSIAADSAVNKDTSKPMFGIGITPITKR